MEIGKTYCTRCGREVKTGFCNNCDPHVLLKKHTIEEIRAKFEENSKDLSKETRCRIEGFYGNAFRLAWQGYEQAYKELGLLEE